MAPPDLGEGRGERRGVQPSGQAQGKGHVVPGAAGLELVEEPEPLLGKGERERPAVSRLRLDRLHRWHRLPLTGQPQLDQPALLGRQDFQTLRELSPVTHRPSPSIRSAAATASTAGERTIAQWLPGSSWSPTPPAARAAQPSVGSAGSTKWEPAARKSWMRPG